MTMIEPRPAGASKSIAASETGKALPSRSVSPGGSQLTAREETARIRKWRAIDVLDKVVDFFCSLKLTIVCLAFGFMLVFAGTMAQVDLGLYKAQNEFFRSFLVFWGPKGASWKIPVLPGGYLVGGLLLLNLIAAHLRSFHFTRKKIGI